MESDVEVIIVENVAGETLVTLSERNSEKQCVAKRINSIQHLILR